MSVVFICETGRRDVGVFLNLLVKELDLSWHILGHVSGPTLTVGPPENFSPRSASVEPTFMTLAQSVQRVFCYLE